MRRSIVLMAALTVMAGLVPVSAAAAAQAPRNCDTRSNENPRALVECVTVEGVREHQAAFQAIADANNGERVSGFGGYNASVAYVVQKLQAAGYSPVVQPFDFYAWLPTGPSFLDKTAPTAAAYAEHVDFELLTQTDGGEVTAAVTAVDLQLGIGNTSTSGCEAADFSGFPAGNIALMQRGTCTFQIKAENAAAAGAVGAIMMNQGDADNAARKGLAVVTLSAAYSGGIPVIFTTYDRGVEWSQTAGLQLHMDVNVFRGDATTYNVIAETTSGNPDNVVMVGAHLDSVPGGPGINDNGSGSGAILEVAENMKNANVTNKVRFAWWGAEESGLVGSNYYVANLSEADRDKIALYLNFDMIGSPNHVIFIYDGDDSDGEGAGPGPFGSAQIEARFEKFFERMNEPYKGTDFSGRSDYSAFILNGIPAGGLFTGAEGIKTPAEAAIWGGTAGQQYDPCYHLPCDTYDNNNMHALAINSGAVAYATAFYANSTEEINGPRAGQRPRPSRP